MKKTTLYIDADDDIASVIQKLSEADEQIVALVLPKRPSVFQSSVNMRLLKKSATSAGKKPVLVSADDQVLQLAGQTELHVAKSLQSKPSIPSVDPAPAEVVEEVSDTTPLATTSVTADPAQPEIYKDDQKVDLATPVGELAGTEEIEMNDDPEDVVAERNIDSADKKQKPKRSIKVPNFSLFRNRFMIGIAGVLGLIVLFVWAFIIAPKATIALTAERSEIGSKLTLSASTAQKTVDASKGLLPAELKNDTQKLSGTFKATGQKDVGTKASGTISLKNCESSDPVTIPSGTGVSKGSFTFITQASVTLEGGNFTGGGSTCTTPASEEVDVSVVASKSGGEYNVASGSYTVAGGFGNIIAVGSAMSGGTSKIITVVTAEDIEIAKSKLLETAADNVKGKLATQLREQALVPLEDTFTSTVGAPTSSIAVDAEATSDVNIAVDVVSAMLGVKKSDIDPLVSTDVSKKINQTQQKVYTTGSDKAVISIISKTADSANFSLSVNASIGPNIDEALIKRDIAGKKAGEAKQLLESREGINKADIRLTPFWVFSIPKNEQKITITSNE